MDGKIIFCKDGVLRFQSFVKDDQMIPLISIQEYQNKSKSKMFFSILRRDAMIESGSTLGSFILCLEPWAEQASDYIDRDVEAYIKEIRKPSSKENAFDYIGITRFINVNRDFEYPPMDKSKSITEWLNSDEKPKVLDTFDIEIQNSVCGYKIGNGNNYSLCSANINEIKNVQLIINRSIHLIEFKDSRAAEKGYVLSEDVKGLMKLEKTSLIKTSVDTRITVEDLIETIFCDGLFYDHPSTADDNNETIKQIIESRLDQMNEEELEKNDEENNEEDGVEKKKKVVIMPDAFEPIISHSKRESIEWDKIKLGIKNDSRYPVRIGKFEEDVPKENRIYGCLMDENNNVIRTSEDEYNEYLEEEKKKNKEE